MYSLDAFGAFMKYTLFSTSTIAYFYSHPDAIGVLIVSSLLKPLIPFIVQPFSSILGYDGRFKTPTLS